MLLILNEELLATEDAIGYLHSQFYGKQSLTLLTCQKIQCGSCKWQGILKLRSYKYIANMLPICKAL